jgi:hypothetical protein
VAGEARVVAFTAWEERGSLDGDMFPKSLRLQWLNAAA